MSARDTRKSEAARLAGDAIFRDGRYIRYAPDKFHDECKFSFFRGRINQENCEGCAFEREWEAERQAEQERSRESEARSTQLWTEMAANEKAKEGTRDEYDPAVEDTLALLREFGVFDD